MNRFRIAYAGLALSLVLAYVAALTVPTFSLPAKPPPTVDEADWGHVRAFDGIYAFTLAPNTDQRKKYELGLGRATFTSAGVLVADDEKMTNAQVLDGEPMGKCGFHFQGRGVNVLIALGKCVPSWATVTGAPETQAAAWIRVDNNGPKPVVVVVRYQ